MKTRTFLLTGIAMLLLITSSFAEVSISFEGNDLIAHSDQEGVAGFKGCDTHNLQKVAAYTFRLLQREKPANNAVCKIPSGKWRQIDERTSDNGSVLFEDLAEGEYKVVCLAGKAIGCVIDGVVDGYPERGIVYGREESGYSSKVGVETKDENQSISSNKISELLLFPNPTQSIINIKLTSSDLEGDVQMIIFDMQGHKLYAENYTLIEGETGVWAIDVRAYAAGVYLVRITGKEGQNVEGKFSVIGE